MWGKNNAYDDKVLIEPALAEIYAEICKQFIGLEVPLNRLESVGVLEMNEGSTLLISESAEDVYPEHVAVEMEQLVLAAYRQKRYALAKYLETQRIKKLMVPVSLIKIF